MGRGFHRLRIGALAVATGSAAVGLDAVKLQADTLDLPRSIHTTQGIWNIGNDHALPFGVPTQGFGIDQVVSFSGATQFGGHSAFGMRVNGIVYRDVDGKVDGSPSFGPNTITSTGKLAGVKVNIQFFFPADRTVRALVSFKNPSTTKTRRLRVEFGHTLAYGSATKLDQTEDGDALLESGDSWLITSDGTDAKTVILWALGDVGGQDPFAVSQVPDKGSPTLAHHMNVTLKPGKTRRIMLLARSRGTLASMLTQASQYNDGVSLNLAGHLTGLTAAQKAQIVNWQLP